jgi:hypothetical protein
MSVVPSTKGTTDMATLTQLVTGIVVASNKLKGDLSELEPQTAAVLLQDLENVYDLLMSITDDLADDAAEADQGADEDEEER